MTLYHLPGTKSVLGKPFYVQKHALIYRYRRGNKFTSAISTSSAYSAGTVFPVGISLHLESVIWFFCQDSIESKSDFIVASFASTVTEKPSSLTFEDVIGEMLAIFQERRYSPNIFTAASAINELVRRIQLTGNCFIIRCAVSWLDEMG